MPDLFWLLLPVAAASGWWVARRSVGKARPSRDPGLRSDYFRGLNYLLNEEPDKAIDVFVQMIEVDTDTVETHIALGNLFRRRGEVERAIRIHQNLIARPALTREQRGEALHELGQDYMRAGLFDRAEDLFKELRDMDLYLPSTLRNLRDIYQQERDWLSCLEVTESLQPLVDESLDMERAHYFCELAEEALRDQRRSEAMGFLKKALATSPECVRACWIEALIAESDGEYERAIELCERVGELDYGLLPEMVPMISRCYRALDDSEGLRGYLDRLQEQAPEPTLDLAVVDALRDNEDNAVAVEFLERRLQVSPTLLGLLRYAELHAGAPETHASEVLSRLGAQFEQIDDAVSHYRCVKCGFSAKTIHWQCPSCRSWSTIRRRPDLIDCGRAVA